MRQAIAFWLILLFAGTADGLMDTLGPNGFLLASAVVMGVSYILIMSGEADEA